MFLREATLTPFKQTPNYPRFMELCINIFRFVGLARALEQIAERGKEKICRDAVVVKANKILMQCFH
jgi:hypothetical protein